MLFANGAVFGHVASGLAHEPDWGAVDGLGPAGANEDGIGGGHERITVAFSWGRTPFPWKAKALTQGAPFGFAQGKLRNTG